MVPSFKSLTPPPRLYGIPDRKMVDKAIDTDSLLVLGLMTSRICNLQCRYCYTDAGSARKGELTPSERSRILREGAELGIQLLWMPGEGEPLLDTGFWLLLEEAAQLGIWTLFYTNGTQVNTEIAHRIANLPCSVVLKINSLRPEVQDELTRIPGSWKAIRRGIDCILATGIADKQRVGGETVVVSQNRDEIPDILRFCRKHGIIPYIERMLHTGRGRSRTLHMEISEEDAMFAELSSLDQNEFGYGWDPGGTFATNLWDCDRILYTLVVDACGFIHPCVAVSKSYGNVKEQSLKEIWTADQLTTLRKKLRGEAGQHICYCSQYLLNGKL